MLCQSLQVSYRSYWTRVVLQALELQRGNLSVKEISELTAIRPDDIVKTLESLNLIKYWKVLHSFTCRLRNAAEAHSAQAIIPLCSHLQHI